MDAEADNISMGSNGSTKPRFKKRSKMNQQEKKEDNAQKWVKEKANKAKAREDPAYEPKPKKPKVNHKYAYEFRFPKRWGDKITLTDYHTLMGVFGARSIRAAISIMRRDPGQRRNVPWAVECGLSMAIGPRTLASWTRKTGLDTYFFVSPDGAKTSKVRHLQIFREAAAVVRISPVTMEDRDPRAKWTTSINAALWQGTGALPEERAANFITILGNLRDRRYPPSMVAAYPQLTKLPLHEGGCQGETLIVGIPSHDH